MVDLKDEEEDLSDKQEEDESVEDLDDMIAPYQKLLNELNAEKSDQLIKNKRKSEELARKKSKKTKANGLDSKNNGAKNEQLDSMMAAASEDDENEPDESDDQAENEQLASNAYSQEVLCKDNLESEEVIKNGIFVNITQIEKFLFICDKMICVLKIRFIYISRSISMINKLKR